MNDLAERLVDAAEDSRTEADPAIDAIADAALAQFELFGVQKSTMEEIARRAKISRVTIYRRFPGKDALVEAVFLRELQRFLGNLDDVVEPLTDVEEKLVEGFVFTLNAIRNHRLLQRLLTTEPEVMLPHLTIEGAPFIDAARDFLAARLSNELEDGRNADDFVAVADIVVRLLLSYLLTPQTPVALDDPEVARSFALRYLRPMLLGTSGD